MSRVPLALASSRSARSEPARLDGGVVFEPGAILADRYRLRAMLGEGGMGQVWSGSHLITGRAVAIKRVFLPIREDERRRARARFLREARAACLVEHPNVVEVLDCVASEEASLLVMELLRGETLLAKLERERTLSVTETAAILLPVVSAVGTAHSRGIVHRDLKPANVFLSRRDGGPPVVKLLDFGIAKWLEPRDGGADSRTRTGATLGTPCYMAPEQAIGDGVLDHRADVWALGVVLYECLTGRRPLEGKNPTQLMLQLVNAGITPIGSLLPELPDELAELIGRMLSESPERRPADLREVFRVLAALSPIGAPAFGGPGTSAAADEPLDDIAASDELQSGVRGRELRTQTLHGSEARPERRRTAVLIGALGLATLLGGLLWAAWSAGQPSPGRTTDAPPQRAFAKPPPTNPTSMQATKTSVPGARPAIDTSAGPGQ